MVKNPPVKAGDTGSIAKACAPQPEKPLQWEAHTPLLKRVAPVRAVGEKLEQQWGLSIATNKINKDLKVHIKSLKMSY